jgi:uncharacterized protein YxjI
MSDLFVGGLTVYTKPDSDRSVKSDKLTEQQVELESFKDSSKGPVLPNIFVLEQKLLALSTTFVIKQEGKPSLGTVSEKIVSLTRSFEYKDASGKLIATARTKIFAWGVHIEFFDAAGRKIGSIKEKITRSLFKVYTEYEVLDAFDQVIATSVKKEMFSTDISIRGKDGKEIVRMHRSIFNLTGDTWQVEILKQDVIDSRIIVMIPAYKTSVDDEGKEEEEEKEKEE